MYKVQLQLVGLKLPGTFVFIKLESNVYVAQVCKHGAQKVLYFILGKRYIPFD